jgi:CrcB protein
MLQRGRARVSRFLLIALGGSLGAVARYGASFWVQERVTSVFPYGTFIVNLTGCLLMGLTMTRLNEGPEVSVNWRFLVPVGFIGGYTTFSSFVFEMFRLAEQGTPLIGLAYLASSVILGYLALWLGVILARAFL